MPAVNSSGSPPSRPTQPLRRAAVAGTWYSADPDTLARDVDDYLDAVCDVTPTDAKALIAPHAGLIYSGPVGAHAYHAVRGRAYDVVVMVGPSHFVGFDGVSLYPRGAFATPLGRFLIDTVVAERLLESSPTILEYPRAHEREHCLEMQLPFLGRVLPDTPIVPMVMGFQTRETILGLAEALTVALRGSRALLIASTDLSHYFDSEEAARLDARVVRHVSHFDWQGLMDELEHYPEHERGRYVACGGGPAVSVMRAAEALGATRSTVLRRSDSAEVSGDQAQVVGYLAAVMT